MRFTLIGINNRRDKVSEVRFKFITHVFKCEETEKSFICQAEVRAKYTDEQLTEMGDQSPLFRYVL